MDIFLLSFLIEYIGEGKVEELITYNHLKITLWIKSSTNLEQLLVMKVLYKQLISTERGANNMFRENG